MTTTHTLEKTPAELRAEFVASIHDDIRELDRRIEAAKSTLTPHGWLITSSGLPLKLTADEAGNLTEVQIVGWGGDWTPLNKAAAQRIAPAILNGNGDPAQAFPLVVALENSRRNLFEVLAHMSARATLGLD